MGDDFAKWLLRIVGVIGLIAFGTTYAIRHDWSRGWMPSANPDYAPPPVSTPETPAPAASAAQPAAPAAARAYVPCQPIGRTAKGELVYSMDCRTPPAQ